MIKQASKSNSEDLTHSALEKYFCVRRIHIPTPNAIRPPVKCASPLQTHPRCSKCQSGEQACCTCSQTSKTYMPGMPSHETPNFRSNEPSKLPYAVSFVQPNDLRACRRRCPKPEFQAIGLSSAFSSSRPRSTYLETFADANLSHQLLHLAALLERR